MRNRFKRHHAMEESLRQAKNLAEQASRSKSQFVANMSHELRTPLNAVLGMLQVLERTRLDAEQLDCVGKASAAGKSLLGLINDVLDFSKLEAEQLTLDPHHFTLDALLQEVAAATAGARHKTALEIMIDAPPSLPQQLVGDNLRLRQVLVNLLSNALKFTAQGHVLLRVECLGREGGRARLRFSVADTGIGIADEQREQVFGEFTQAEASITRRFGGTGLGLAISRRLVALMGGTLQVESKLGAGSRFWFEVELLAAPQAAALQDKGRIAIVDDYPATRDILAQLLPELGWQADVAAGGKQLLALVRHAEQEGRPYRLALIDYGLQGESGLAVAQQLRESGLGAPPGVVMLAAYDGEVQREQDSAAAAPYARLLHKPFSAQQLAGVLDAALQADTAPAAPQPGGGARRLAGMRILVVEDQAINRQVAERLLVYEGATVLQADGGASGMAIANRYCSELDVILMDLQMPDMDGFSAARAIQANPASAHIPIIAMTANAGEMDRKACLQAGMADHIGKPIDIDNVVRVLRAHIGHAPAQSVAREPAAAAGDDLEPLHKTMQRFGDSLEVYGIALAGFAEACGEILDALESRCAQGDGEGAAGELHALKGVASTLGANGLAAQCAALEQGLKAGGAIDSLCGGAVRQALRSAAQQAAQDLLRRLPAAEPAQPPEAALQNSLDEIRTLLEFGSLDAVDKLEELLPQLQADARADAGRALEAVLRLEFEQASGILGRLGQALEVS